jgi:hypothetical protein
MQGSLLLCAEEMRAAESGALETLDLIVGFHFPRLC